jgi:hypothetical protein
VDSWLKHRLSIINVCECETKKYGGRGRGTGKLFGEINMKPFFSAHVHGFNAHWKPRRPFAIDMAGFAVRLSLIFANPGVAFTYESPRGFLVYFI